ncbi:MAG TPA: carboxypeptidase-like regulatory domain-containing protein, partial [Flavisolibacter sp.]
MRKGWLFCLLLLTLAKTVSGQQGFSVRGTVTDTAGQALQGVTITLIQGKDSVLSISNVKGTFSFSSVRTDSFTLRATYTGLQPFHKSFERQEEAGTFLVPPIQLSPAGGEMDAIVIKSVRPVTIKEDTVQFDAAAYKVREGAVVEEVVKKLPGVTVDKDGNIEAQGKKVARLKVNGKDFFGGDVQTALQNLPADVIQNIQIIDDYGEGANLTGIKNGEPEKVININTQPNKNRGNFGNATIAGGNEGRYAANVFGNHFNDEKQISFLAAINNTNANLFNFNSGGRGGGARGANLGNASRGGGGAGITLSKSIGANFRDKWGEKLSVNGSYSFSSRNTGLNSSSFSQDINPQNIRNTERESKSENHSANHRITLNLEYSPDSVNYIKVSPYFSYSQSANEANSRSAISRKGFFTLNNNLSNTSSHSPNGGGTIFYLHRFGKRGRNFSTHFSVDFSDQTNDRFSNGTYHNIDSTASPVLINDTLQIQSIATIGKNSRTNLRMSYTEPLNEKG